MAGQGPPAVPAVLRPEESFGSSSGAMAVQLEDDKDRVSALKSQLLSARQMFLDPRALLDQLSAAMPRLSLTNLLVVGTKGCGKKAVISEVFDVPVHDLQRVSDSVLSVPLPLSTLVLHAAVLPHDERQMPAFEDEIAALLAGFKANKQGLSAVWFVADLSQPLPPRTRHVCASLFSKQPVFFVLNKQDIATDAQRTSLTSAISDLQLHNLCSICTCSARPTDINEDAFLPFCSLCGCSAKQFREGRHECVVCGSPFLVSVGRLRALVSCTLDVLPKLEAEALATAQHISVLPKFERARAVIADFLVASQRLDPGPASPSASALQVPFIRMAVRLAMLWGVVDASENTVRQLGNDGSKMDRRKGCSCKTGNYSSFVRWLQETLSQLPVAESASGGVVDLSCRYAAEGICLCRSLSEVYLNTKQGLAQPLLPGKAPRNRRVSMRSTMEAASANDVRALEYALISNGLGVAFEQFLQGHTQARARKNSFAPPSPDSVPPDPAPSFPSPPLAPSPSPSSPSPSSPPVFPPGASPPASSSNPAARRKASNPLALAPPPASASPSSSHHAKGPRRKWFQKFRKPPVQSDYACFGVSLDEVALENGVPVAFARCLDFLWRKDVCKEEGLFRIPGNMAEVAKMKEDADEKGPNWKLRARSDSEGRHTVATLFKEYLRELPVPLIPFEQYEMCLTMQRATPAESRPRKTDVQVLLTALPAVHLHTLTQMIQLLNHVASNSETNLMTAHNLGVCFGPDVLRAVEEDLRSVLQDLPVAIEFLKNLIDGYPEYFEQWRHLERKV